VNREQKKQVVKEVAERFTRAKAIVLTDFRGLNVEQMNSLRRALKERELEYKVVKNTLLKLAGAGTAAEELVAELEGPNGVAFSYADPVELAKVLVDFAKDNPQLTLKKALVEGRILGPEEISQLAKLPGREQLLAMVLGAMAGVPRSLVSVLNQILVSLVQVLKAIEEEKKKAA